MGRLGKWSVDNRVAVNLVMIFVIVAGWATARGMRREMFPQFALDFVNVRVVWPGATPEEVEEGICIKIEEQLKGIESVARTFATAHEGYGSVTLELDTGADVQAVLEDVKREVDLIETFPEEAETPVVTEVKRRDPTVSVAVYGEVSEKALRALAEEIRDDLVDTDPISMVDLVGVRDYEIAVEVGEDELRRYGLRLDDVARAIRSHSLDLPGGTIKGPRGEVLVRAEGRLYTGAAYREVPLITRADGTTVRLGQVARVTDGFEDTDLRARFNGRPAAIVQVNRTDREDIVRISETVTAYVAARRDRLPDGVRLATWFNLADMVQERIDLLLRNGTQGIVLVFLALALFLNLRLAFWVAAGIPISFMAAFLVLDGLDATVNMISLFAFIMTLGILVDDAIIVGENVYAHHNRGLDPTAAVVAGMGEVGGPVVLAVTTTVVAFLPLMFIAGIMGKFIAIMPQAVIAILLVSLFEALVILPAHLFHALGGGRRGGRTRETPPRLRRRIDAAVARFIEHRYAPLLRRALTNRYLAVALAVGVLIVSLAVVAGGYVPYVFIQKGESDWIIAEVTYPLGTPMAVTGETVARLEARAFRLNQEPDLQTDPPLVQHSFALVGAIPRRDWKPGDAGGHCGQVWIELLSSERRPSVSVQQALAAWRRHAGDIPGIERLSFFTLEGGPGGAPIEIQLAGDDLEILRRAADRLKSELATYPGVFDVADDFLPGKPERRVRLRPGARALGITMADVARQVRQAYYGEEAVRIQRGRDDIKVMVRYAEADRRQPASLERMRLRTADGRQVPLTAVAEIVPGRAYADIHRTDRRRTITVSADLDEVRANASRIVADLQAGFLPELLRRHPGLTVDLEGQEKRTRETMESLQRGFLLALMGIFLLLAYQFKSYFQPLIIMAAIPFGLIGAIVGHWVMGLQITMISIFGFVALSGIAVNDSLILIDFINRAVRGGRPLREAVVDAGQARFRAVLLTSVTTIAGLFPLLLESSFQAQFLVPMAVSICFGLLAATVLTLLFVPALYLIVEDVLAVIGGARRAGAPEAT